MALMHVASLITNDEGALLHLADVEAVGTQNERCPIYGIAEAQLAIARLHRDLQGELRISHCVRRDLSFAESRRTAS